MKYKAIIMAALLSFSLAACSKTEVKETAAAINYEEISKPEKIRVLATTIADPGDGFEKFTQSYKDYTGIDLEIELPDHNLYYERVNIAVASSNLADVVEVGGSYYPTYAHYGLLYDMSDLYDASPHKGSQTDKYAEALRVDGKLYGFPMMKGNGTITHVRKDWLERFNISEPKNYSEFINMLEKFKTITYTDPETGKTKNVAPVTASGIINTEYPYNLYLPEFYQGTNPDFYYSESEGKYVDGMLDVAMKDTLRRFKDAWDAQLIDPDIFTNKTSDCRNKFYAGQIGCFNYWSGSWTDVISENVALQTGGEVEVINPIEECMYIERSPLALVIPNFCENPEGVFKYFIDYSHDGGEGEILFSRGVEGQNWGYKDGKAVLFDVETATVAKMFYTPELSFTDIDDPIGFSDMTLNSLSVLENNSVLYPIPISTSTSTDMMPEIDTAKRDIVQRIITGELGVDEGINSYIAQVGEYSDEILEELNGGGDANE